MVAPAALFPSLYTVSVDPFFVCLLCPAASPRHSLVKDEPVTAALARLLFSHLSFDCSTVATFRGERGLKSYDSIPFTRAVLCLCRFDTV